MEFILYNLYLTQATTAFITVCHQKPINHMLEYMVSADW